MEPSPKAAVVVPTFDGRDMLRDCLEALRGQTFKDFEVRVVDNGSADGTREMLAGRFPEAKLVTLGRNLGFARAVNAGRTARRTAKATADTSSRKRLPA